MTENVIVNEDPMLEEMQYEGYYTVISLNVMGFRMAGEGQHKNALYHVRFKDPGVGFLMTLEKALRQGATPEHDDTT